MDGFSLGTNPAVGGEGSPLGNSRTTESRIAPGLMSTPTFDVAESDFQHFAVQEGFPATLLWTTPDELVFWRRRIWVLVGKQEGRRERAKAAFDRGAVRNLGIMIHGKCKMDRFTICRVYAPEDQTDAEYRMIPQVGVKLLLALNEFPTVLVPSRVIFDALKWWRKRTFGRPDWE